MKLTGNIFSVLHESFDEGMDLLKGDIIRWMAPLLEDGITMSDFTLVYSTDQVENHRVWTTTSVVTFENF